MDYGIFSKYNVHLNSNNSTIFISMYHNIQNILKLKLLIQIILFQLARRKGEWKREKGRLRLWRERNQKGERNSYN